MLTQSKVNSPGTNRPSHEVPGEDKGGYPRLMNWKTYAELIGLLAIVASLIFVGLELRQSHQIALAAQYQARTDAGREYFYRSLDSDYRLETQATDLQVWDWSAIVLTDEDEQWLSENPPTVWAEAAYWAVINLYGFDNYHYQFESGLLSEEGWLAMKSRLRGLLHNDPFARYLIAEYTEDFRLSFATLSMEIIAEMDQ